MARLRRSPSYGNRKKRSTGPGGIGDARGTGRGTARTKRDILPGTGTRSRQAADPGTRRARDAAREADGTRGVTNVSREPFPAPFAIRHRSRTCSRTTTIPCRRPAGRAFTVDHATDPVGHRIAIPAKHRRTAAIAPTPKGADGTKSTGRGPGRRSTAYRARAGAAIDTPAVACHVRIGPTSGDDSDRRPRHVAKRCRYMPPTAVRRRGACHGRSDDRGGTIATRSIVDCAGTIRMRSDRSRRRSVNPARHTAACYRAQYRDRVDARNHVRSMRDEPRRRWRVRANARRARFGCRIGRGRRSSARFRSRMRS